MIKMQERGALRPLGQRGKLLLVGAALAGLLAACGGGGGSSGSSVFNGGTSASTPASGTTTTPTASASDLVIVLSKSSLANSTSDSLTATVTAIDSNRASVANVPVSFAIDSGGTITAGGTTTGTDGTVSATAKEGSDTSARTITITATSGSISRTVSFSVVPSPSTTTPQAADLSLTLDASSVNDSGSAVINATATAVDSNRNALQGIPIQLAVDSSAVVAVSGSLSDNAGKVTGVVSIGADRSNRTVTVTATSGTLTKTAAFRVTGANLQITATPTVTPSSSQNVTFKLVDVNQNAMGNQAIAVTASGLPSATSTTDANGQYVYTYTAPSSAGTINVSATAGGVTATTAIAVSGSSSIGTASTPSAATMQISPNVVSVNSSGTTNQSTLSVNFVDSGNLAVKNVRVRFDVNDSAFSGTSQYGTISQQSVYSDASGNATSTFVPAAIASPTNGVTIRACWSTVDFTSASDCPHSVTSTLTVVSAPVSISIGTDNTISTGNSGLTYVKKFAVLVVDAAGNPKSDVQITPSIDLAGYAKGNWTWGGTQWVVNTAAVCPAEDLNRNGVIDSNEDVNGNLQLDPRKSDVSITLVGSTKTDANGVAVVQIEYPKDHAGWVEYKITAAAAGVLSPPAYFPAGNPVSLPSTRYTGGMNVLSYLSAYQLLPVDGSALNSQTAPPPFVISPYGTSNNCNDPN